jgi:hypothetical protein
MIIKPDACSGLVPVQRFGGAHGGMLYKTDEACISKRSLGVLDLECDYHARNGTFTNMHKLLERAVNLPQLRSLP